MRFEVHSCAEEPITVSAEFNGQPIAAQARGLTVELVSADGRMSQTLRYIPADLDADKAKFQPGGFVIAAYEKENV